MKVKFLNLIPSDEITKYLELAKKVLLSGSFILGKNVQKFEEDFARYTNSKYAIALNSGTDALILSIKYLNLPKNAEVLTVPNSYFTTTSAILMNSLKVKFVDVGEDYNICPADLERKISKKTKLLVMPHLGGRACDMLKIKNILKKNRVLLVEDCAQAIGTRFKDKHVGNFGFAGCFSLHPLKNLSGFGDGGIITTNNSGFVRWLKKARNNGHSSRDIVDIVSNNSRLDEMQASFLIYKLKKLNNLINQRRKNAKLYISKLNNKNITLVLGNKHSYNTYHLFNLRVKKRDRFIQHMNKNNIETKIHYPISINKQKIFSKIKGKVSNNDRLTKEIVSIPINEKLNKQQIEYVIKKINEF